MRTGDAVVLLTIDAMRILTTLICTLAVTLACKVSVQAQPLSQPDPIVLDSVAWRAAGEGLDIAIIDGSTDAEGEQFTMLLRLADGYWIRPHTHNVAKRLLVLSGDLLVGYGIVQDEDTVTEMVAGDFLVVPAEQAHYEGGRGETIVALYGVGPFRTTFIKDAP